MIWPNDTLGFLPLVGTGAVAYLIGSVPFGMVAARLFGLGDIRQIGSGNIGATNVLRSGNKFAALFTLIGDIGKGILAVLLARYLFGETAAQLAALGAIIGHCYPVWLRFKGGKGVATFLGLLFALYWPVGLAAAASWLAGAAVTRISSASALIAAGTTPLWFLLFGRTEFIALSLVLLYLIVYLHRENIDRLIAGAEPKIGKKK